MIKTESKQIFEELFKVDVTSKVEKKKTGKSELSYLSWAWAWAEVKKRYPEAEYTIERFANELPYVYDEYTGYMVFTTVTIGNMKHEMWLPVMDGANKAMKSESYTYKTKYEEKTVEAATMFDINKTIMRCLVKNLAMHGLGLYIYAGEDLPETEPVETINTEDREYLFTLADTETVKRVLLKLKYTSSKDIKKADYQIVVKEIETAAKGSEVTK